MTGAAVQMRWSVSLEEWKLSNAEQESLDHGENHPSHRRRGHLGLGRVRVFHAFGAPTKLPLVVAEILHATPP